MCSKNNFMCVGFKLRCLVSLVLSPAVCTKNTYMRGDDDVPVHNFFFHLACFENNKDLRKQSFENNRALWSKAPTSRLLFGSKDELQDHWKIVQEQTFLVDYILWLAMIQIIQIISCKVIISMIIIISMNKMIIWQQFDDDLEKNTTKWQSWQWPW